MGTTAKGYVVRAAGSDPGSAGVRLLYPYTLKGLTDALEEARFRSYGGDPHVLAVITDGESRIIRRYEHGHEVPVA